jgi:hypothetical protein
MSEAMPLRLRLTAAATLPATGARPLWMTSNPSCAAVIRFRSSCAKTPALGLGPRERAVAKPRVLGDRVGDGVVETQVERVEFFRADGRIDFGRELGDGLTDVAVVVNDLGHRILEAEERRAVSRGRPVERLGRRWRRRPQRLDQLVEEHGDAALDLALGGLGRQSLRDLHARSRDELIAVGNYEFGKHCRDLHRITPPKRTVRRTRRDPRRHWLVSCWNGGDDP